MAGTPLSVSIVIPTFNRPRQLGACLESLVGLVYPRPSLEVVLVDDGSPTPLDAVVAPFRDALNLTLIRQENAGPATARNAGAGRARGDLLVFIDDDCAPAPDYVSVMAGAAAAHPGCALGGRTINALTRNIYSAASQLLNDYLYGYYNADPGRARFLASNNLAVPSSIFRELNGFDTRFTRAAFEDRDLCERLQRRHRLVHVPEAVIYHSHGLTLRQYCRQHYTYGRGSASFHSRPVEGLGKPPDLEPGTFYLNLIRYPFSKKCESASALAVLLAVSQAATAFGFVRERLSL